jgi:hypothetical protein
MTFVEIDSPHFVVIGYGSKLFRDDDAALYVDAEKHMIHWRDREDLTVDRYDGRCLLDDYSCFMKKKSRVSWAQ